MHRPDPFNSHTHKKKTEPILHDLMGNDKNFMVLYSYKRLSTTVLSGFLVLYLNFPALKGVGITDKKSQITFTESESLPAINWIWLIFSMFYVELSRISLNPVYILITNSTTPISIFLQSQLPLNHLISTLNSPLNLSKCDK